MANPRVWMDITIGGEDVGRLTFEIYPEQAPRTVDNFMKLCTGEKVDRSTDVGSPKPLVYTGCTFHRACKGFMVQGGDFTRGNGHGGWSIYGEYFDDENLHHKYTFGEPYRLGMANCGPNTNNSQFFITCVPAPHLDGTCMLVGRLEDGIETLEKMVNVRVNDREEPLDNMVIKACGKVEVSYAMIS